MGRRPDKLIVLWLLFFTSGLPVRAQYEDPLTTEQHLAPIRGVQLWYHVRGNGPVIFLQPEGAGWGGDTTIYTHVMRPLEDFYTLVYLDPRGIGRSDRLSDPSMYSLSDYVQDLEALRAYLDLPAITIVGHGHGGYVALQYALRYPDHLDKLILVSTSPFADSTNSREWLETRRGFEETAKAVDEADKTGLDADERLALSMKALLPVIQFNDLKIAETVFAPLLEETTFSAEPYTYFHEVEAASYDVMEELDEIRAPVLIIYGEDEMPWIKYGSEIMRANIPISDMVSIEKAGHWPMIERPALFFSEVVAFLRN